MMTATEPVAAQPKGHKKRNAKKGKKASVAAVEEPLVKAEESADAQVESQDKAEEASAIQGLAIAIQFPEGNQIQLMAQPATTVYELKQIVSDSIETHSYTCFQFAYKGTVLDLNRDLASIEDLGTEATLDVLPVEYNQHEVRVHITRLREMLTNFKSPIQAHGLNSSQSFLASYLPTGETDLEKEKTIEKDHVFSSFSLEHPSDAMFQGLDSKTPETIDCLKSMSLSGWHPAPFDRQMAGDIMYLNVVTLENETYEVTSSASGFFVNASTALEFNPAPAKESFHSHNLITLLTKFSPTFAKNFPVLKQSVMSKDPYEYILAPYPVYPWRVSAQKREYDLARQMDATMNVTDVIETMTSRDWNEDIQSARELPRSSVQERVIREQAICKSHSDFVEASMKGVVAIVQKSIPPVNPMDPELSHMFINNNIFFSQGYDSRDQYERYGGEEAAHVGVSKDIDGVRMVSNLDMENMFTLGTAVVDYKGIRTVCQTIVPGILKKAVTGESSVKYGSVDSGKEVSFDESFHESLRSASRLLHVAEHSVNDINGKEVSLFTSVDTKGILGTDSRRYLLDLYRMTPVDICFLEETQNEENADTKYPHQMTLLRPELIDLYYESKIREYVRDHQELQQKAKEEGKTDDSVETAENPMLNVPSLLLNTDAFTKIALSGEPEQIKEQEQQIRDVSEFLNTKMIAQFVLEMANYPTNIPIDSEQLTKVLHSRGINMRYLGKITNLIKATEAPNLAYLRDLCELEMLARAAKKVMRELLAPVPMSLVSTCISHFFNCLFSSGDAELRLPLHASLVKLESYNFEKLTPATLQSRLVAEIKKRFRYEFSLEMPTASPLALLRAICLKVGIQVEAKSYDFTATSTFAVSDILNIYPVAKHSEPKALFAEQVLEHGLEALMRKEDTDGLDMLREAVSMFEQVLGPIHPETARVNAQFALIKANQGNMDEARYYQKKSLLGYERSVGIDDPSTLQQYINLAQFEFAAGRMSTALKLAHHAAYLGDLIFANRVHADRAVTLNYIGSMLTKLGDVKRGLMFLKRSLADSEFLYGKAHPVTMNALETLVQGFFLCHDYRSAMVCQRRILSYNDEKYGAEDDRTKDAQLIMSTLTERAVAKAKQEKKDAAVTSK